ncbi:unnamed protein product [Didymodactylos carnosus]|uniref:Uncharacterized protein n=1 Tax=Didymodactylos carnosus TaxID=1234261 RepID=A0A8S2EL16_9BILA|nr:unnamed protein product [Didymodactylos carnosus]CAF3987104.1 unnamed protein product [Didymodactylos carnosus]
MSSTQYRRIVNQCDTGNANDVVYLNKDTDITIIWFDDNLDIVIREQIEHLHDKIIICLTNDHVTTSMDKTKNNKIILIVSGQYSRQTLTLFHNNPKIISFYIFYLNRNCTKICIRKQLCRLLTRLPTFKLFEKPNIPIDNSQCEPAAYLWYILKDALMEMETERKTDAAKQEMVNYCRTYYHSCTQYLRQIDEFEETYTSIDAVRCAMQEEVKILFDLSALFQITDVTLDGNKWIISS